MTFDPTHDKLPDMPVTIGGDKSAAAWHPNTGPEVPHADLIARLHRWCDRVVSPHAHTAMIEAADALAALGDTVPREEVLRQISVVEDSWRDELRDMEAERDALQRAVVAATERAEAAEAERDALAHVLERLAAAHDKWDGNNDTIDDLLEEVEVVVSETRASVFLALHDAEVKAQALDDAAATFDKCDDDAAWVHRGLRARAAAIRAEAK